VNVTTYDMHSNDELEITNITRTSFDIGVKHGASYVIHDFGYSATGYGREV
jgi:hypothetical protein